MASRRPEAGRSIPKEFKNSKLQTLSQTDRSKKGSIDAPISSLIERINASPHFYTTSSCSGRVTVLSEGTGAGGKGGCRWLFASHDICLPEKVLGDVRRGILPEDKSITLKFEPLILHICCANTECAKALMKAVVGCGYRNSGLSLGKRIVLAVRSTQGMEVPLGRDWRMLVGEEYLRFLIGEANAKLQRNADRIIALEQTVSDIIEKLEVGGREIEMKKSRISDSQAKRGQKEKSADLDHFIDEENILENLFQI